MLYFSATESVIKQTKVVMAYLEKVKLYYSIIQSRSYVEQIHTKLKILERIFTVGHLSLKHIEEVNVAVMCSLGGPVRSSR
jgi:hypothetical protein